MAALHPNPHPNIMLSIAEGLAYLEPTGYPMTRSQLEKRLKNARAPRERHGRTDYYDVGDILVAHHAFVTQTAG